MDKTKVIPNRLNWIDWAKSICMLLVILGHCHIRESEQFVTQYVCSFRMSLFFFISGLLCKRDISRMDMVIRKDLKYLVSTYMCYLNGMVQ